MTERNFRVLLDDQWSRGNFVCVGLDPDVWKIPAKFIPNSKNVIAATLFNSVEPAELMKEALNGLNGKKEMDINNLTK